jgi:hypothetical protein
MSNGDRIGWAVVALLALGAMLSFLIPGYNGEPAPEPRGENPDAEYCSGPYCY